MNTFLPYESFEETAKVLDMRRLGKMRVETLQMLNALSGKTQGWANHPATRMWRNSEANLAVYGIYICQEWKRRGYRDTCEEKLLHYLQHYWDMEHVKKPSWLGNVNFHAAHRSALLFKNFDYYKQFGWAEQPKLDYIWPK